MAIIGPIISAIILLFLVPWVTRLPKPRMHYFLGIAIAVFLLLASTVFPFSKTDDEYITFRVVHNFFSGHGMIFNSGEWMEALTNLGWALLLSLLPLLGFSLEFGARWLSLFAAVFAILGVNRLALNLGGKRAAVIAPFILLFLPFFQFWSTSGLETMIFAALCTWSLALSSSNLRFPYYALIAGIAAWVRPEAPLIFIASLLLWSLSQDKKKRLFRGLLPLLIFGIIYGGTFLFRNLYYGTWLSPTAFSKIPLNFSGFRLGIPVIADTVLNSPWLFVALGLALPLLTDKRILVLYLLSLLGLGYIFWLGPDAMKHERLLSAFIPSFVALGATGIAWWSRQMNFVPRKYLSLLGLNVAIFIFILIPQRQVMETAQAIDAGLHNAHYQIAEYLQEKGKESDSLAVQDAGLIGYLWSGKIIDLAGIFDPTIISIHRKYDRVSNDSQSLPPETLQKMNSEVADYVLNEARPRFIVLVYYRNDEGIMLPSRHNHNLGSDARFQSRYHFVQENYFHANYIMLLYDLNRDVIPDDHSLGRR